MEERYVLSELSNHLFFERLEKAGWDGLTPAERTFRLVDEVLIEVNNGGFEQYFWNSSGDRSHEAVAALREIGAETTANLLEKSVAVFGSGGPSADASIRERQVSNLTDEAKATLDERTSEFYDRDDAADRQLPFVLENREQFLD